MNPKLPLGRRLFLTMAGGLAVSACQKSPALRSLDFAYQYISEGVPDVPVTRETVQDSPYALIYTKLGRGPRSILVLSRYANDGLHWISADEKALVTRHGRLVKTAGFDNNLRQTRVLGDDPLAGAPHRLGGPVTGRRLVDFDYGNLFGVPVDSVLRPAGPEVVHILDQAHETVKLVEDNHAETIDWTFQNVFWVDRATGEVRRSIQYATPYLPEFDTMALKPPSAFTGGGA